MHIFEILLLRGNKKRAYTQPNIAVVSVNTDLDVRGVPRAAQIEQLIESGCRGIVLNMSECLVTRFLRVVHENEPRPRCA